MRDVGVGLAFVGCSAVIRSEAVKSFHNIQHPKLLRMMVSDCMHVRFLRAADEPGRAVKSCGLRLRLRPCVRRPCSQPHLTTC